MFEPLLHALPYVFQPANLFAMVAGVVLGIAIGALPGAPMLNSGPDALQPDVWRETLSGRYPDLPDANLALRLHVTHKALERSKTQ